MATTGKKPIQRGTGWKRESRFTPRFPAEVKARFLRRIEMALDRPVVSADQLHRALDDALDEARDVSEIEDNSSVKILELPEALTDALESKGILTIGQLQGLRECDLDTLPGIGPSRSPHVRIALESIGRLLRDPAR